MRYLKLVVLTSLIYLISCSLFQSGVEVKYRVTGGPARVRQIEYLSEIEGTTKIKTHIEDVSLPWEKTVYLDVKKGDKITLYVETYGLLDQVVLEIYMEGELKARREGISIVTLEYEVE